MNPAERARFLYVEPRIDPTAYVAPQAVVIGDVRLGPRTSVWPMAVLRGDINFIEIGEESNIQDGVSCISPMTCRCAWGSSSRWGIARFCMPARWGMNA